jgi:hypothetical protein
VEKLRLQQVGLAEEVGGEGVGRQVVDLPRLALLDDG